MSYGGSLTDTYYKAGEYEGLSGKSAREAAKELNERHR
jgi:hypothetical protein